MNPYQKAATLVVRLVGGTILMVVALGMLYFVFMAATGQDLSAFGAQRVGSFVWGAVGLVLIAVAKPIGRLMGRGLD